MSTQRAVRFRSFYTLLTASLVAQMIKNLPVMQETQVWSLGHEDFLEKRMAIHSSILAWRSPWTEEPGGLQSMGPQRVGHDWAVNTIYTLLEKAMAPHSSTLAWKILWTEEPGRLQSTGSLESDTTERLHFHFSLSCIGGGNGNPLQCSCLENPRDGKPGWLPSMGSQSRTRLKRRTKQK